MKKEKFSNNKLHQFHIFHCRLRAAVNPSWSGSLSKTIQTCWNDATASYARTRYWRLCRFYAFHKGKQNFVKKFL